jgi:hypothetical protein
METIDRNVYKWRFLEVSWGFYGIWQTFLTIFFNESFWWNLLTNFFDKIFGVFFDEFFWLMFLTIFFFFWWILIFRKLFLTIIFVCTTYYSVITTNLGTIHLGCGHFFAGEGSKIGQICWQIVVKKLPEGGSRGQKLWKFADVLNGWSL